MTSWWHDQAGRFPLLTPAQEIHLGQQVRAWLDHPDPVPPAVVRRGQRARERFTCANLRLVISISERYHPVVPAHFHDDLVQAGNLGLMRSVEKYDPARGYRFSTYAYWWIKQGIHQWLDHNGRTIRLPTTHATQFNRLQNAIVELTGLMDRTPTRAEIAEAAGVTVSTMDRVLSRPKASISLDQPNPALDDCGAFSEVVSDSALPLLEQLETEELLEHVMEAISRLDPQAQRIICDQFLSPCPSTQTTLARQEGIGRDVLRAVISRSLRQLRPLLADAADQLDVMPCSLPPPVEAIGPAQQLTLALQ